MGVGVESTGAGVGCSSDKIGGKTSGWAIIFVTSEEWVSGNIIVLLYCSSINLSIWLVSAVTGGRNCVLYLAGRYFCCYIGGIIFLIFLLIFIFILRKITKFK